MSDAPDGTTQGTVPSKAGIMAVASTVLHPDALDPLDFTDWYENTHIQEVQATGGVSSTQRYESLTFDNKYRQQQAEVISNVYFNYDFLTIYNMPDLAARESDAFRGLAGQSKPSDESILEKIFKQSSFSTRFCEQLSVDDGPETNNPSPAPFLVTIGVNSTAPSESVLPTASKVPGYRRVMRYKIHENSVLSAFERSYVNEPSEVAIFEFDSRADLKDMGKALESADHLEVGFWTLRKEYAGDERTPAAWEPKR
ncbi:hypothetical protein LTR37_001266 [Vermiconidia calcicola]|uniref:Uncharacterized protein n=1 Tax=Vermiconidia calcicola TaxID=1690605 RepID=A0ACC3NVX8_9PEZI|nr:hypothetical protein LTR37_001266 [Vermiconidia calcicola]